MPPALIHYHMDHFSCLPLLICKLPLQQRETWLLRSSIHLLDCSIPVYVSQYQDYYLVLSQETTLSTRVQGLCIVSFAFSLTNFISSVAKVSVFFPQSPLVRLFYTTIIQLDCFVTFCIYFGIPQPYSFLEDFLNIPFQNFC